MKLQMIACAVAIATGGLFFSHTINEAFAATEVPVVSTVIKPSQEQALVARQLATLVDRQHYLNMRLDAATSNRILDMYLDSLDPDHSLFLSSEVEEYKNKYGSNFGSSLKAGNLTGPFVIHEQYRERLKQFYVFMLAELKQPQNLQQKDVYLDIDREKAAYFKTTAEQRAHWQKMLVSQLINLTISKEEEQAKQKALKVNPSLANGQDLTGPEDLTPVQTLTKRYTRQLERMGRVKSDDVLDKTLNAMLATYDPHSNYYPPIDAMELNRQTTLQLEGIGVSIRPERGNEDYTKIETIVEGGPASKSGQVKSGDRIIGVAQDGEKMLDEDFIMNILSPLYAEIPELEEYLTYFFDEKELNVVGSCSRSDQVLAIDLAKCEVFYPTRRENQQTNDLCVDLERDVAMCLMLEVADPKKATSDYLSKCDGRFSWSKLTAEEKNATIGNCATNDPSESEFATFTEVLTTGGRIGLDLASGIGQTRYNNDFGRGQEEYVTGRRSKKAPSVKSVGLFHDLPVELQDSLVVTSKRHAPKTRQKFRE